MAAGKATRAGALALAGVLAVSGASAAGPPRTRRARVAVRYVVSQQQDNGSIPAFSPVGSTADAVVAMVAARRAPRRIDRALDYLRRRARGGGVEGVGLTAKVALAVVAGGRDPRRFGGRDLLAEITETETPEGRYGARTAVFDHALALLALAAGGIDPSGDALGWLVAAQCGDGGWQYDAPPGPADDEHCVTPGGEDPFASDTNTTALAVQALEAVRAAPEPDANPFRFFRSIRDADFRGWGYSWGLEVTDANSTAMVIQAYRAAGRRIPKGAGRALTRLQHRLCGRNAGAFAFTWTDDDGDGTFRRSAPDAGATIAAIPAMLREPLPVAPAEVTKPAPRRRAC